LVILCKPSSLGIVQGIDHFGNQFELFGKLDHGASILVPSAVVGSRKHGNKLTAGESLEAVHDALVRPEYVLQVVVLEELADAIRTELHDVSGAVRVSHEVGLNTQLLVTVSGIRPQDVNNELLLRSRDLMDHFKRSLDSLNLVKGDQCLADTTMQTHESLFDHGGQREPVKEIVDLVEN